MHSSSPAVAAAPPAPRARGRSKKAAITFRVGAGLHLDVLSCILHRLDTVELLIGGVAGVCRSWRHAARDEPELWHHIDLRCQPVPCFPWRQSLGIMLRAALRLSAGQCETFYGHYLNDDNLLLLTDQAPTLKSLHLIRCYGVSSIAFEKVIKKFPLLEELELSLCSDTPEEIRLFARECPRLKHFRNVDRFHLYPEYLDGRPATMAFAISKMHGLRSLNLVGDTLDNEELAAVLDNCPYLEYLNMRDCPNVFMVGNLGTKCARIDMDDYEYYLPPSILRHLGHCSGLCSFPMYSYEYFLATDHCSRYCFSPCHWDEDDDVYCDFYDASYYMCFERTKSYVQVLKKNI